MKKSITAAELIAKLEADPEYQARMAQDEQERQERLQRLHAAEKPILEELKSVGCSVESVWDLIRPDCRALPPAPFPEAIPILLKHLSEPYPGPVLEWIGRALAVPEAREYWDDLVRIYRQTDKAEIRTGLADAISAIAGEDRIEEIIDLARQKDRGSSRLFLLDNLAASRHPEARKTLEEIADDPDVAEQAGILLRRLEKRERRAKKPTVTPDPPSAVPPRDDLEELSMSFDLEDVPTFLEAIAEKIGPSLPTETVRDIVGTIEGMDVEEELSWALEVDFEGRSVPLQVAAFMDDSDAPDLYLFTVPGLAKRLEPVFEEHMK